ncbi:molybdenum ABC transporter ATP-binding protein [Geothrix sp. PMB-07]|uniref:molybdenum ABC transporter ATP-binding protein n=1 Tax=Geothrix sp. PMB-07 TaxID=3068640 RepID=UPI00274293D3|nr:ATP-binding cassette domain-containing protein [Geothrix sp. PMB-07]WLT32174.1 ATP-binding cassette domain-containing protein [Geothrix sp. PMB-07]
MELKAAFSKTFPGGPTIQAAFQVPLEAFGLTVIFGPSGCGKTTVLRCLAGLEAPDAGLIQAGGEAWFQHGRAVLPASGRSIGFVSQDSALFPHLSVAGNIAYGIRGCSRAEGRARVAELIAFMGLEGLAERRPAELSGGQKQRVALARALAPRPRLVLLDEPFVSLDRAAAEQLRHTLRKLLQELRVPCLLVTHDPLEALALGDRMLRMAEGRIVEEGEPARLLSRHDGAAGDPLDGQMGVVVRTRVLGRVEGLLRLGAGSAELLAPDPGGDFDEAFACIRGEGVALEHGPHGPQTPRNRLVAEIVGLEPLGGLTRIHLDAGFSFEALITTWACQDLKLAQGQTIHALIKASAIGVIPIRG